MTESKAPGRKVAKNGNHVGKESSFTTLQRTKTVPAAGDVSDERR